MLKVLLHVQNSNKPLKGKLAQFGIMYYPQYQTRPMCSVEAECSRETLKASIRAAWAKMSKDYH